jgi:peptidoglycan hydrolase-like protein with peptidoglycan-binding domain
MSDRPRCARNRAALLAALSVAALPLTVPAIASAELGDETLKRGDRGADVRELQRGLNGAGYRTSVDGQFGRQTLKRVRAFEGNEQLRVDGKVTPPDAEVLEQAAAEPEQELPTEEAPPAETPGSKATLTDDGLAVAPADAPQEVQDVIAAGNEIAKSPYLYGGGHGEELEDDGYDCSGSMSYALRKAGLQDGALASGGYTSFGDSGRGEWITTRANAGHSYMMVAGLRFDTSARKQTGTRWADEPRSGRGYVGRHPEGF